MRYLITLTLLLLASCQFPNSSDNNKAQSNQKEKSGSFIQISKPDTEKPFVMNLKTSGNDFLELRNEDNEKFYVQNINLWLNDTNILVNAEGYSLYPTVVFPPNYEQFDVTSDGSVRVLSNTSKKMSELAKILKYSFSKPEELTKVGDYYQTTEVSGVATQSMFDNESKIVFSNRS